MILLQKYHLFYNFNHLFLTKPTVLYCIKNEHTSCTWSRSLLCRRAGGCRRAPGWARGPAGAGPGCWGAGPPPTGGREVVRAATVAVPPRVTATRAEHTRHPSKCLQNPTRLSPGSPEHHHLSARRLLRALRVLLSWRLRGASSRLWGTSTPLGGKTTLDPSRQTCFSPSPSAWPWRGPPCRCCAPPWAPPAPPAPPSSPAAAAAPGPGSSSRSEGLAQ